MPINFLQGSNFPDDAKLTFGDSSDLKIWHDSGTGTSYISDQGTGNLHIQADSKIRLESYAATEKFAIFELNGAADIYYDNNLKLSTTNTGISITGGFVTTSSSDCAGLNMTSDIAMGANNITTTGYIGRDGDNFITFNTDDSILLRVAGSYRGRWDSTGLNPYADSTSDLGQTAKRWANLWVDSINGSTPAVGADYLPLAGGTMTGNIICPDGSVSAPSIGNTGDTNTGMYWPGDHQLGFAVNGSRKFYISETKAYFQNLSSGIEIGAGGIDVTGNSSIQGSLSITGDGSNAATLTESGSGDFTIASVDDLRLDSGGNDVVLRGASSSEFGRLSNSSQNFVIKNITADKDIIFQADDGSGGTTTYFKLDGSLTILEFSKNLYLTDDVQLRIGTGSDLKIYHDATNSNIVNETGNLLIEQKADGGDIIFYSDDGSGNVAQYFRVDGGDLEIYHDGSNSYIKETGTGVLYIQGSANVQI